MRLLSFASRNRRELLRDPLSLLFGIGLPVFLLLLISLIQNSMSDSTIVIFDIENFTPGMAMFSLSFLSLFTAILIAGDRDSSFLARLFASPLTASDYIIGYSLPLVPIAVLQSAVCFVTAFFLGLRANFNALLSVIALLPTALLFIAFGLLFGCIFSNKQAGPISSILVQVAALSSGIWFPLGVIGGVFRDVCYALPFAHAVDMARYALSGNYGDIWGHFWWVLGYTIAVFMLAITLFRKKMKG
ncbi:MAG: ABC transporter permease [Oscillospiraceae bacterium]